MSRWLKDYSFELPPGRVAQRPSRLRDQSRLLVLDKLAGEVTDSRFHRLPGFLRKGDLLVMNDSAVLPARLDGRREGTGGKVELLLLEDLGRGRWRSLMKGKAAMGMELGFGLAGIGARISKVGAEGEVTVDFTPRDGGEVLMKKIGMPPLPPYIRRDGREEKTAGGGDRTRYQTIYASRDGSAAAPTAGLHFTRKVFGALEERGVKTAFLTLHVGPGTFRPLREENLSRAVLESERAIVPAATARVFNMTREAGGRVVAVGTTVTRTLESFVGPDGRIAGGRRRVDLLVRPGYRFRAVDGLVTNFHLPRSSLLLLVSAMAGRERILEVYRGAVEKGYRFYSYGDAMLIL
jgi:S-adenosylmethionine:tRNA ribosyltransferase-isomerase